jgi:uncharacterized protein YukE
MATKSIINIEVNSEQFKEFHKEFKGYSEQVKATSVSWGKIDKNVKGITYKDVYGNASKANKEVKNLNQNVRESGNELEDAGRKAKRAGQEIFSLGNGISRIFGKFENSTASSFGIVGKVTGIIAGIALAGVYGLSKLADMAVDAQKRARSANLSSGDVRAFDTDFGRLGGQGLIDTVTNAKFDPEKQVYLMMAAGLKDLSEVHSMNPVELASKVMMNAREKMLETPPELRNSANMSAFGFPQLGVSANDMNLWMNTPQAEHNKALNDFRNDKKDLSISDKDTGKFYEMNRQIDLTFGKAASGFIEVFSDTTGVVSEFAKELQKSINLMRNYFGNTPPEVRYKESYDMANKHYSPQSTQGGTNWAGFGFKWNGSQSSSSSKKNGVDVNITNSTGSNIATSLNGLSL